MSVCGQCFSARHPSCCKATVGRALRVWPRLLAQPSLAINHFLLPGRLLGKRPTDFGSEQDVHFGTSNTPTCTQMHSLRWKDVIRSTCSPHDVNVKRGASEEGIRSDRSVAAQNRKLPNGEVRRRLELKNPAHSS